ncbi:hypothetical protein CkaCkLH20_09909 [Colletotrichum karsti]|uniref:Alpha-L-rhamnosidase six-hairpin glycosidase domain-containing protein n=1 Tax=Colletotrichum karsti TaxID=1095194 RepID=A0A9P6LHL6_9PEZI|nr:uncharacterized protein CkaCkLH20_09909 [Colletotrichum karsti]KAF9872730.1 hypothetical protein CkaCkLH20_09909 [Colletotrichum karsti]
MDLTEYGSAWIWHPDWIDNRPDAAGGFLYFRKTLSISDVPSRPVYINLTADTRYKLYINKRLVHSGPVKGDENRWFYDTIDIRPFLQQGQNQVVIHVLRFFYATTYATSFPRMPIGGLYVRTIDPASEAQLNGDDTWETAVDVSALLRSDEPFDLFLHIFEQVDRRNDVHLSWTSAKGLDIQEDWGVMLPWRLCARMIPPMNLEDVQFNAVNNVQRPIGQAEWESLLLRRSCAANPTQSLRLPSGSKHHVELAVENHTTAFLTLRFASEEASAGSKLSITYSECYEDDPVVVPFARRKGDRTDKSKKIVGPSDSYILGGLATSLDLHPMAPEEEVYQPFHYRTFRYLAIDIEVPEDAEVHVKGVEVVGYGYPLAPKASFDTGDDWVSKLWSVSLRTLQNCMHDCYEDCPFYEQMQYPMDTRSSALFTYLSSGDDRLARQAIVQLHDSFVPSVGLTSSRSVSSVMQRQFIPAFSLYWICMVVDHFEHHADAAFARRFLGVSDAIIETFSSRIDAELGLVRAFNNALWEYTDWTTRWAPQGIPTALRRTGVSTYTNCLFVFALKKLAWLCDKVGRGAESRRYEDAAGTIVRAVRAHCFDGEFFTDGLALELVPAEEFSQHSQVWAVLAGVATGELAVTILERSLAQVDTSAPQDVAPEAISARRLFTPTSISFSFYTLRALAAAGDEVYNKNFHSFWSIWREQIAQNLTTWAEDAVSVRSDCHAWGSAPIHEFLVEVAGIRPAQPGWSVVMFKPRLSLSPRLKASIPVRTSKTTAILEVSWERTSKGRKEEAYVVNLRCSFREASAASFLPVMVCLPGREPHTIEVHSSKTLTIKLP